MTLLQLRLRQGVACVAQVMRFASGRYSGPLKPLRAGAVVQTDLFQCSGSAAAAGVRALRCYGPLKLAMVGLETIVF